MAVYSFFLFGVVYAFRHRRFMEAISLLVRDPFGRTESGLNSRPIGMRLVPNANKTLRASVAADRGKLERDNMQDIKESEKTSEFGKEGMIIKDIEDIPSAFSSGGQDIRL